MEFNALMTALSMPNLLQLSKRPPLAALLLVVLLAACGGGGEKKAEEEKPKPKKKPAAEAAEGGGEGGATIDGWVVLGENPKWKPIQPLFDAYAKREVTGLHNPMRSNLVAFVEKPVPTATVSVEETTEEKDKPEVPVTPLTRSRLSNLTLILLVSGVAQPKAVLTDMDGNQIVVVRGDHLGSEGGVVKAITQYELQISVPGEADVVKSLKPPINPVEELDAETQSAGKKPEL